MQKEREQRAGNLVRETPLVEKFFVAGKNIEEGARALHPGEHRHIRTWRASRGKEENERGSNGDKERKSCDRPERERERGASGLLHLPGLVRMASASRAAFNLGQ